MTSFNVKVCFFKIIIPVTLFVTSISGWAQGVRASSANRVPLSGKGNPLKILLIGNSFSQNATTYLKEISKEKGHELVIGHAEIGGCSLQKHWSLAELASKEPTNPKGRPYQGKSLQMLLSEGKWDVVTLQQYSMLSADRETYFPYIKNLFDTIRKYQPQARIVLHQTWAYRSDSKSFGKVSRKKFAATEQEMYEKSRAAYHMVADSLHIEIIPTGDAFWAMSNDPKWMYKKDEKFNFDNHTYPDLPDQTNSLNRGYMWDDNQKLLFDTHHASNAGKYLGSLVWYSFLFGEPASKVHFVPVDVPAKFAARLRECADKVIKEK